MGVPYTITPDTISVRIRGELRTVDKSHANFESLKLALIQNKSEGEIDEMSSVIKMLEKFSDGGIEFRDEKVFYRGLQIDGFVVRTILEGAKKGEDIRPVIRFLSKVLENPEHKLFADDLFKWMKKSQCPLADDGDILAYKITQKDGRAHHVNPDGSYVRYVPGQITRHPDPKSLHMNRSTDCGSGLHWGNKSYAFGNGGDPIFLVKVDPRKVTSIPYGEGKGRSSEVFTVRQLGTVGGEREPLKEHGVEYIPPPKTTPKVAKDAPKPKPEKAKAEKPKTGKPASGSKPVFTANSVTYKGRTFTKAQLRDGVKKDGQRKFAVANNIPRSSLQMWLNRFDLL